MTLSDAEDDQPNRMQNGNSNPIGSSASSSPSSLSSNGSVNPDQTPMAENTANKNVNHTPNPSTGLGSTSDDQSTSEPVDRFASHVQNGHSENISNNPEEVQSNGMSSSLTDQLESNVETAENGITNGHNEVPPMDDDEQAVGASSSNQECTENFLAKTPQMEKVSEKLQQIEGYIKQTSAAMLALEEEGDLNKINQYNTLVKCLRELKKTESKLSSHLSGKNETSAESADRAPGTESIGVVRPLQEERVPESFNDRMARHEVEASEISDRIRNNLVRRQELMARYQATRERLSNLKRQRIGIANEERRLLQSMGAPASPYEDPIPGAANWSCIELERAIIDFQGLRDKVNALHSVYIAKIRTTDEGDEEAREALQLKLSQIETKKTQIGWALTQLADLLRAKREAPQKNNSAQSSQPADAESMPVAAAVNGSMSPRDHLESQNSEPGAPISGTEVTSQNPEGGGASAGAESLLTNAGSSRTPAESTLEDLETGIIGEAFEDNPAIASKKRYLNSLKEQLKNMKELLKISTRANENHESDQNDSPAEENENSALRNGVEHDDEPEDLDLSEDPLIESEIVGLHGQVVHLSDSERRNPQLAAKYNELTAAKKRLAKMEDIISLITEARHTGQAVSDILGPEDMAILNAAREEEEQEVLTEASNATAEVASSATATYGSRGNIATADAEGRMPSSVVTREVSRDHIQGAIGGHTPRGAAGDNTSLSSYLQLDKESPQVPSINEGRSQVLKYTSKDQPRELWGERRNDPQILEMIEDLNEKKNALEVIMQRMEKSSSSAFDSISDRNSDTNEKPSSQRIQSPLANNYNAVSPSRALLRPMSPFANNNRPAASPTRPLAGNSDRYGSNRVNNVSNQPSYPNSRLNINNSQYRDYNTQAQSNRDCNTQSQSNRDCNTQSQSNTQGAHGQQTNARLQDQYYLGYNDERRHPQTLESSVSNKTRLSHPQEFPSNLNPFSSSKDNLNSNFADTAEHHSMNNLNSSASHSNGVRPKLNRFSNRNIPVTSWENVETTPSATGLPPATAKVQNSVSFALSQLNQLQETISSLYGDLRAAEENVRPSDPPSASAYARNAFSQPPEQHLQQPFQFPNASSFNQMPQEYVVPGVNSAPNVAADIGRNGTFSPLISGAFQQCFSQLRLHSLEIQSLSKQLQNMERRFDARSSQRRREVPMEATPRMNNSYVRDEENYIKNMYESYNPQMMHSTNTPMPNRNIGSQATRFANDRNANSWIGVESLEEELNDIDNHYLLRLEKNEEPPEELVVDWDDAMGFQPRFVEDPILRLSPPQIEEPQQQNSDILNNQVLPGTRANNYWDNFRSYSRQNPLSSCQKTNTLGRMSIPEAASVSPNRVPVNKAHRQPQSPWSLDIKNGDFKITFSNNTENKTSDKNSSSSRSQTKSRGRSRHATDRNNRNAVGPLPAFPHASLGGSGPAHSHHLSEEEVAHKWNNRSHERNGRGASEYPKFHLGASGVSAPRSDNRRRPRGTATTGRMDPFNSLGNDVKPPDPSWDPFVAAYQPTDPSNPGNFAPRNDPPRVEDLDHRTDYGSSQSMDFMKRLVEFASRIKTKTDRRVALDLIGEVAASQRQELLSPSPRGPANINNSRLNHQWPNELVDQGFGSRSGLLQSLQSVGPLYVGELQSRSSSSASDDSQSSEDEANEGLQSSGNDVRGSRRERKLLNQTSTNSSNFSPSSVMGENLRHPPLPKSPIYSFPKSNELSSERTKRLFGTFPGASSSSKSSGRNLRQAESQVEVRNPLRSNNSPQYSGIQGSEWSPRHANDSRERRFETEKNLSIRGAIGRNEECLDFDSEGALEVIKATASLEIYSHLEKYEAFEAPTSFLDNLRRSVIMKVYSEAMEFGLSPHFFSSLDSKLRRAFTVFETKDLPRMSHEVVDVVCESLGKAYSEYNRQHDKNVFADKNFPSQDSSFSLFAKSSRPNPSNEFSMYRETPDSLKSSNKFVSLLGQSLTQSRSNHSSSCTGRDLNTSEARLNTNRGIKNEERLPLETGAIAKSNITKKNMRKPDEMISFDPVPQADSTSEWVSLDSNHQGNQLNVFQPDFDVQHKAMDHGAWTVMNNEILNSLLDCELDDVDDSQGTSRPSQDLSGTRRSTDDLRTLVRPQPVEADVSASDQKESEQPQLDEFPTRLLTLVDVEPEEATGHHQFDENSPSATRDTDGGASAVVDEEGEQGGGADTLV